VVRKDSVGSRETKEIPGRMGLREKKGFRETTATEAFVDIRGRRATKGLKD
jgi:hypothetical protein